MDRYKEALERAKKGLPIDEVFPELEESEDERIRKEIVDFIYWAIDRGSITKEQRERSGSWLAYLERQKEQRAVLPGDEDDEDILNDPVFLKGFDLGREVQKIFDEPKQEWSEEDERKRQACISTINEVIDYERERWEDYNPGKPYRPIMKYDEQIDWLKSLRPQPHWKPSKVQMEALKDAFRKDGGNEYRKVINSLYCDLQKLL